MKKDFLSINDITREDFQTLMNTAAKIKADIPAYYDVFKGRSVVMIFDKPSLRTRVTFEVAMTQFGGRSVYMPGKDISLGVRESVPDGARNLSRWVDAIVIRTFGHEMLEQFAENSTIPIINALTDQEHPCQALACMLTMKEHLGDLNGKKLVYVGDGNNVAHSLMLIAPLAGVDMIVSCPAGYEPDPVVTAQALKNSKQYGTSFSIVTDPFEAVKGADLIYTDVWASMGQEDETAKRAKVFSGYQVNENLVAAAGGKCLVSHCLPAHRGMEITSEVLDSPVSVAFDEAENRLHAHKAVLYEYICKR